MSDAVFFISVCVFIVVVAVAINAVLGDRWDD